jgi:hypothetical protein
MVDPENDNVGTNDRLSDIEKRLTDIVARLNDIAVHINHIESGIDNILNRGNSPTQATGVTIEGVSPSIENDVKPVKQHDQ